MSELKTEHDFPLTTPISYAHGGDQHDAAFIKLLAPSSRNSRECAALKQAFFRAVGDNEGGGGDESNIDNVQGVDVILTMAMSGTVDLPDVIDTAKHLFTKGKVALVDGEAPLTKPLLDLMSEDDIESMLGEYLVNFTLASSLQRMKAKSSPGS